MNQIYKARKGNRSLRIPEERIKEYSQLGYIKDDKGNIVFEPEDKSRRIAELEKENAALKEKLAKAEKTNVKQTSSAKNSAEK